MEIAVTAYHLSIRFNPELLVYLLLIIPHLIIEPKEYITKIHPILIQRKYYIYE